MSDPIVPNGRVANTIYPISFFNPPAGSSSAPVKPYPNEMAFDDTTNIIYVAVYTPDGNYTWQSQELTLMNQMNQLNDSGIVANANSFVQNRKIFRLFFDATRKTLRLDPTLYFDPNIARYYKVRQSQINTDGSFYYVTGIINPQTGSILTDLIDFNVISENGQNYAVAAVGSTVYPLQDRSSYVVEIYDNTLMLTDSIVFQAIASNGASVDLTPDSAVVDLIFVSSRLTSDDTAYLYQGESYTDLDYRVYLKYGDGSLRDVSYQQYSGGALQISGLSSIVTTALTGSNTPQFFTVTYFLNNPNTLPQTANGLISNPQQLSIARNINVNIIADVMANVLALYPVPYVATDPTAGNVQTPLKVFALFQSLALQDVSTQVAVTGFNGVNNNSSSSAVQISYGVGTIDIYTNNYGIIYSPAVGNPAIGSFKVGNTPLISANEYKATVSIPNPYIVFTPPPNSNPAITDSSIQSLFTQVVNGVTYVPNCFRIRDGRNFSYIYVDVTPWNGSTGLFNTSIPYILSDPTETIALNEPLLIELMISTTNGGNTTYQSLGVIPAYIVGVDK